MRYNVTSNFTQISETSGTIQNISNIYTVEVSDRAETGSGILLYPLDKFSFNDTALFMRCLDVVGKAEIIVVPFDATEKGGGGGGNRPDFALDQTGTNLVDNFRFSALAYPNATNPNLDGKTVLVLSVKDANGKSDVVKYIFVDLAKVIDVYSAGDSSILVTDGDISVQISKAQDNILSIAADGLFANLAISGGVSGNFAVIGASGLITDGGLSLADLELDAKMDKVPTAVQSNVAIFDSSGAVADGEFNFADIEESIDAKIDKVTSPTQGDIVIFGLSGALADGGFSFADIADSIDAKVDKVTTAVENNFAVWDADGALQDSGLSAADFVAVTDFVPFAGATSIAGGASGLVPSPVAGDERNFLRGDGTWASPQSNEYTAGYGLSLADNEFSVTLETGGGLSEAVVTQVNNFFTPRDEFKDRYAEAPFDSEHVYGLDLSHLVDGTNFELDTENLTDGAVTRIRSGTASYHVDNGISRGYVEVKTICECKLTVTYSISSESGNDYGGCIITENAPNTTFTRSDLTSGNFFDRAGGASNQTKAYTLKANKTYYLNFGYAKNASTDSNDDRFYIHKILVEPKIHAECPADYFFDVASNFVDCVVGGVGGVFTPSVSSVAEFFTWDNSNYRMLDNKLAKVLAGSDYSVPQYSQVTLCGGEVTASILSDSGSPKKWSLASDMNGTTKYVTLVSDTAAVTNNYKICPLTDSGGFIYRSTTSTVGYAAGDSIQPFVITSTGTPSLGTATSIHGSQSASYPRLGVTMSRSIFDPTHILFFAQSQDSNGTTYKYTTIAFQGYTNTYTRVKALTTLGTDYSNTAGKTNWELQGGQAKPWDVVPSWEENGGGALRIRSVVFARRRFPLYSV